MQQVFEMKIENFDSDDDKSAQSQLHDAVRAGDTEKLVKLLSLKGKEIDIDQPDWYGSGNAAVLDATISGNVEMVRVLCENGCDANARTLRGETSLHIAVCCRRYSRPLIELLVSAGCSGNVQDNVGRQTALHMFLRKHAGDGSDFYAVFETLAACTDVNLADHRLRTALHDVASARKPDCKSLQILLNHNADPNLQNDRGETPLHEALEHNNEAIAKALITAKAKVYLETKYKETPLHIAARKNMYDVVPALLAHEAPINAQDLYGNTALHLAASKGYKDIVALLVENQNIQLNVSNKEGLTPLHLAVESGFIYTVEILVKADSCDLTAQTKRSETALDLAQQDYRRRSQPEMTEVLSREIQRRSCGRPS